MCEEPGLVDIFTPEPEIDLDDKLVKKSQLLEDKLTTYKSGCFLLSAIIVCIALFSILFTFFIN